MPRTSKDFAPVTTTRNERVSGWKKAVAAGVSLVALAGCTPGANGNAAPSPSVTTSATEKAPSSTPSVSASETQDPKIAAYEKLFGEDFYNLPRESQLLVVQKQNKKQASAEDGSGVLTKGKYNNKPLADYNPEILPLTKMSSGDDILGSNFFAQDMCQAWPTAEYQPGMATPQPLDQTKASQLVAGFEYYTKAAQRDDMTSNYLDKILSPGQQTGFSGDHTVVVTGTSDLKHDVDKDGKAVDYKTIEFTYDGHTWKADFAFVPISTMPKEGGFDRGVWLKLRYERVK
jgi:hypothetical protein